MGKLSSSLKVRLAPEQVSELQALAEASGENLSKVIRRLLTEAKPVFRARLPDSQQKDRKQALHLYAKTSNNMNQIARHLNTLNLQNKLEPHEFMHYLRILDTIEFSLNKMMRIFDAD